MSDEIGTSHNDGNNASWMNFAICHGKTHLFFPKLSERPQARLRRESLALTMCRVCPVSSECREFGRENREYGFWGGEGEIERHLAGFSLPEPVGMQTPRILERFNQNRLSEAD